MSLSCILIATLVLCLLFVFFTLTDVAACIQARRTEYRAHEEERREGKER